MSFSNRDIRVVVAIGKYTKKKIPVYKPGIKGGFKTNTALQYDDSLNVLKWGFPALAEKETKKGIGARSNGLSKPVELFKLRLGNMADKDKPSLPSGLDFKKAITDYLHELGKLVKEKVTLRWPGLLFDKHVLLVLALPTEYEETARAVMRQCAYEAHLITSLDSNQLEFTTEPEAAAIYCIDTLKENNLSVGSTYMVVDCGGGTIDLTVRTLQNDNTLDEVTESSGDFCGSTYIDREFKKHLIQKVGAEAVRLLEEKHYAQMQYLVQQFCTEVKFRFDGNPKTWKTKEIDLEEVCPVLMQYVKGDALKKMEKAEWLIKLDFAVVKEFFDKVIGKILRLVRQQLKNANKKCSAIFVVGGFGESKYLILRLHQEFDKIVPLISVPTNPITSVVRGAVLYGLNMNVIQTRVLRKTFGCDLAADFDQDKHPPERKYLEKYIKIFQPLASRGKIVKVDQKFSIPTQPLFPHQTEVLYKIYTTHKYDPKYCDEDGMTLLGKLDVELPDVHLGKDRPVEFSLTFGTLEIKARAHNITTGQIVEKHFEIRDDFENDTITHVSLSK
ncbi:hypothetical protein G9A89_015823 [Geosiphon pyriformis]|nr:hypothetical protein G9A89_015823 [Geosiphon pyriformis]